jgi:flagellar biogenesis protein FliO
MKAPPDLKRFGPLPIVAGVAAVLVLIGVVFIAGLVSRSAGGAAAPADDRGPSTIAPGFGAAERPESPSMPDAALDITLKLLAVLAVAYVSLALLRRSSLGTGFGKRDGLVQVLDSANLGPNRSIYYIKIMDKRLVLGATPTQISMLAAWDLGGALSDPSNTSPDFEIALKSFEARPH